MLSVCETENEAIHAALETGEPAKEWRSHIAVHFAKIAMVGEIDRIQADGNLVPAPVRHERQAHSKNSIKLCGERKKKRGSQTDRDPCVILWNVDGRETKTSVDDSK